VFPFSYSSATFQQIAAVLPVTKSASYFDFMCSHIISLCRHDVIYCTVRDRSSSSCIHDSASFYFRCYLVGHKHPQKLISADVD
jgi:hypothetical protein